MSDLSPNLALPYMQPSQAQKHVTHNEALERLDVVAQLCLEAFATLTPPGSPVEGEAHGVGAGAGGAWAGQDGRVAAFLGGAWVFLDPQAGWRAWGRAEAELRVWDGSAWAPASGDLNNLAGLGIGTSWDATNRLAVTSDAALFTHAGAGHQMKLNKAGPSDTASLLYQTNWSGRAEMGLAGSDDFVVKVSDGTAWFDAVTVDHTTGAVSLPQAPKFNGCCNYDQYSVSDTWFQIDINTLQHDATGAIAAGLFTAPHAGIYLFGGGFRLLLNTIAPDRVFVGLSINGAAPDGDATMLTGASIDNTTFLQITGCLALAAGDTVALHARFNGADAYIDAEKNFFWGSQLP